MIRLTLPCADIKMEKNYVVFVRIASPKHTMYSIIGGNYIMNDKIKIKMYSFTVDCKEPYELAKFYAALLNWEIPFYNEEWACVGAPGTKQGTYPGITFQRNSDYKPPVWPQDPEAQQQMAHLDFAVNDLEKAVEYAVECLSLIHIFSLV